MFLGYGNPNSSSLVEFSRSIDCFSAFSLNVTSLPAYSATALGPILYNGSGAPGPYPEKKVIIFGISVCLTTASGADVAVGLAWGSQLTASPPPIGQPPIAATTPITLVGATYPNQTLRAPVASAYNAGTVATAATNFLPLLTLPTTAITALNLNSGWIPLDEAIVLPAGGWVALAASATATSAVLQYAIVWGETTK